MNRLSLAVATAIISLSFGAWAQQANNQPRERVIEVTGSAELNIVPDEIYLSVTLKEYQKDKNKMRLDAIDGEFKKTVKDLGIEQKDISIEGASAYHDWDYWKQRPAEFLATKTYIIKLPDMNKYNQLMQKLDNNGIQHAYLQRTDHSRIEEYRKQVKVEALKAAKEKARMLLEAIGEMPGEVIFIKELNQNNFYPMFRGTANMSMDAESSRGEPMNADMQKIKLRYEVEAHFRIK